MKLNAYNEEKCYAFGGEEKKKAVTNMQYIQSLCPCMRPREKLTYKNRSLNVFVVVADNFVRISRYDNPK